VKNTQVFEQSVMSTLTLCQRRVLQEDSLGDGLKGPVKEIDAGVRIGRRLELDSAKIGVGDVVFRADEDMMGVVVSCASEAGRCFVIVEEFEDLQIVTPHAARGDLARTHLEIWSASDVMVALAWYEGDVGFLTALR
jgi:hypothetical protein